VFAALAEPRRREIVELLAGHGEMSAGDISHEFKVTAAAISQHLKVLREAEIVRMEKQAQQRIYTINTEALHEIGNWARRMEETWEARFDQLDRLLSKETGK
jgi:DNA-binding transcriptional ArsR family regulator